MTQTILVIDDEADIRDVLADIFEDEGYNVLKAAHSEQAFNIIKDTKPDLIVLDIWLENSDMDGIGILKDLKNNNSSYFNIPVLMISGHGNIEMAVKAMRIGAYDYIEKPFKIDHMLLTVERALEQQYLKAENSELKSKLNTAPETYNSKAPMFQNLLKTIYEDRGSEARVVITGEPGTGKTRIANYIHSLSNRYTKTLYSYYAGDLKPDIIEKWFKDKSYDHSTVLIKHIDKLSNENQIVLLKFLSGNLTSQTPRLMVTSFLPLNKLAVDQGFSSALADRLSVTQYMMPSLSDRQDDMNDLVSMFITQIDNKTPQKIPPLSSDAVHYLCQLSWPGNVSQLKSFLEFLSFQNLQNTQAKAAICKSDIINFFEQAAVSVATENTEMFNNDLLGLSLRDARDQFERVYLTKLLQQFRGNVSQMASHVDMERTALHRKLKSMDIKYENISAKTTIFDNEEVKTA
jgi:two-component system nitrogen regulation response regulator NtrX